MPHSVRDLETNDIHVQATHRLTEALLASEKRMRRRIELLSEVVFETGADGTLTFLNPAWTKTLGYGVEESLGTELRGFVEESDWGACGRWPSGGCGTGMAGGCGWRFRRWSWRRGA